MGEAMLIKAGFGGGNGSNGNDGTDANGIPIMPGYTTLVVTIKDSAGVPLNRTTVYCNDGNQYSQFNTNEQGMTYFMATNASVRISVDNNTYIDGVSCRLIDQNRIIESQIATNNRGGTVYRTITLPANKHSSSNGSNFMMLTSNGNIAFSATTKIGYLGLIGGGGGGSSFGVNFAQDSNPATMYLRNTFGENNRVILPSGGGGGYTEARNIPITPRTIYKVTVGSGGTVHISNFSPLNYTLVSGGTTSAFGYSAVGGQTPTTPFIPNSTPGSGGIGNSGNGGNGTTNIRDESNELLQSDYINKIINEFPRIIAGDYTWRYYNSLPSGMRIMYAPYNNSTSNINHQYFKYSGSGGRVDNGTLPNCPGSGGVGLYVTNTSTTSGRIIGTAKEGRDGRIYIGLLS